MTELKNNTYSAMQPVGIPPEAKAMYPDSQATHIGPPPGVGDDTCGTPEVLVFLDPDLGVVLADYWRPTTEQLQMLLNGGYLELRQYTGTMVMHSLTVHAKQDPPEESTISPRIPSMVDPCPGCGETVTGGQEVARTKPGDDWWHKVCYYKATPDER